MEALRGVPGSSGPPGFSLVPAKIFFIHRYNRYHILKKISTILFISVPLDASFVLGP
jgi:hypothetical protein